MEARSISLRPNDAYPRIDSHQHFWRYDPARDTWITDDMAVLKRDFLPDDLLPDLQANGISGTVAIQTDQSEAETTFLLELAAQYPQIRGVVGWVDLCAPNVREQIDKFARSPKLRGLRHIAQAEADDFLLREDVMRGIAAMSGTRLAFDILIYERQLPAVLKLADKFPSQRFVIDHLAKPAIKARKPATWSRLMRTLATNANVYCKLSGLVTEADWKEWKPDDLKLYLDVVFDAFGTARLMFGSDWPVCLLAASYKQVVEIIEEYVRAMPVSAHERIFAKNAIRFYRLEE
jgi:L-fuconolactonase